MFKSPNNLFINKDKPIYIAKRSEEIFDDYNNQIITYEKPYYYGKRNYQPLTLVSLKAYKGDYGIVDEKTVQCLLNYTEKDNFKVYDLVYLYGATPDGEEYNGQKANYVVKSVRIQNVKVMVLFEERELEE